jgi:hypothetical protein
MACHRSGAKRMEFNLARIYAIIPPGCFGLLELSCG